MVTVQRIPQSNDLPTAPKPPGTVIHAVPGPGLADDTADTRRPKFPKDDRGFQADLEQRVVTFFQETGRGRRDCWQMYMKTAIGLVGGRQGDGLLGMAYAP
jgi:hypothetical protein